MARLIGRVGNIFPAQNEREEDCGTMSLHLIDLNDGSAEIVTFPQGAYGDDWVDKDVQIGAQASFATPNEWYWRGCWMRELPVGFARTQAIYDMK